MTCRLTASPARPTHSNAPSRCSLLIRSRLQSTGKSQSTATRLETSRGLLKGQFGVDAIPLESAGNDVDRIVLDFSFSRAKQLQSRFIWSPCSRCDPVDNSTDKQLFTFQLQADPGSITRLALPNGPAKVEIFLAMERTTRRALRRRSQRQDRAYRFNPENEPGGASGIARTFDVDITNGVLVLSIPAVQHGAAVLCAIRVTDSQGNVIRRAFRDSDFWDQHGQLWSPADPTGR